ncbi:restriction endonuclease [Streptomyces cinerochromogenes]|uniref:restriction endonuclease n=1 Tax=Streptomyces cinerochromogenes TaxID=66422 RepID=UPI0036A7C074
MVPGLFPGSAAAPDLERLKESATAVVGGAGWVLLRAHRLAVGEDRAWRAQEEARVRELSMAEVDALSWQESEAYVADLCRRDGCTKVVVSGKSGDLGADVVGCMADGRKLVIQCKKCTKVVLKGVAEGRDQGISPVWGG